MSDESVKTQKDIFTNSVAMKKTNGSIHFLKISLLLSCLALVPIVANAEGQTVAPTPTPLPTATGAQVSPIDAKGAGNVAEGFSIMGRAAAIEKAKKLEKEKK